MTEMDARIMRYARMSVKLGFGQSVTGCPQTVGFGQARRPGTPCGDAAGTDHGRSASAAARPSGTMNTEAHLRPSVFLPSTEPHRDARRTRETRK